MAREENRHGSSVTVPRRITLDLLENFRLTVGEQEVPVPDGTQRLVALLALKGRPLRRSLVAGTLWPEKSEPRASANLRSSLWRLHGARPDADVVVCHGSSLALNPLVELDVSVMEHLGWGLLDGAGTPLDHHAVAIFSRELLPGWYEDWVIAERERLSQLQIRALEALVHACVERGEAARSIDLAMRLVAKDPLREPSQHALVRALVQEGSWARAHVVVADYCRRVDETFGTGASRAFATTYRSLVPSRGPS